MTPTAQGRESPAIPRRFMHHRRLHRGRRLPAQSGIVEPRQRRVHPSLPPIQDGGALLWAIGRVDGPREAIPQAGFTHAQLPGPLPHRHLPDHHLLRDYELISPQPCHRILRAGGQGCVRPVTKGGRQRRARQWQVRELACSATAGIWVYWRNLQSDLGQNRFHSTFTSDSAQEGELRNAPTRG